MGGWSAHKSGETEATGGVTRGQRGRAVQGARRASLRHELSSGRLDGFRNSSRLSCYISTETSSFSCVWTAV